MNGAGKPSGEARAFARKVGEALQQAVAQVVDECRRAARPLVVSRDGKVALVPADLAFAVREPPAQYVAPQAGKEDPR